MRCVVWVTYFFTYLRVGAGDLLCVRVRPKSRICCVCGIGSECIKSWIFFVFFLGGWVVARGRKGEESGFVWGALELQRFNVM